MNLSDFNENLQNWLTAMHLNYEINTPLGHTIHEQLLVPMFMQIYRVRFDPSIHTTSSTFYTSRTQCDNACRTCVHNAYTKAVGYLSAKGSNSMVKTAANDYAQHIQTVMIPVMNHLETISDAQSMTSAFDFLKTLIYNSPQNLFSQFQLEITKQADFYSLTPYPEYENQIDIETLDFRVSSNGVLRFAERLLTDNVQYHMKNMYDIINELEFELNDKADSFFHTAHCLYIDYIRKMEQLLDMIGHNLPALQTDESYPEYLARCSIAS